MKLPLNNIRLDGGTQTRARINEEVIEEYAVDMKAGSAFPPLIVFHDGKNYWLADGFHRWGAAKNLEIDSIECDVRQGTLEDAQWFSYAANRANGMRRTNDDKVRAVKSALRHCKGERGDREISRHVGVTQPTVGKYRTELEASGDVPPRQPANSPSGASCKEDKIRNSEAASDQPTDPSSGASYKIYKMRGR